MFRWLGVLGMLRSTRTTCVLSLGKSQTSIAATSLLFSSTWSRSTCPSGFAGSSEELQATHHRFTPPTKNCTSALSIHNIATISSYVCGRTSHRFVAGMTVGRGTRTRIGAWSTMSSSNCGRPASGYRSMQIHHTASTALMSTSSGFTDLCGHISSPPTWRMQLTMTQGKMSLKMCTTLPLVGIQPQRAPLQRYMVRYSNATNCYPFDIY